jgi:hypothetical protein
MEFVVTMPDLPARPAWPDDADQDEPPGGEAGTGATPSDGISLVERTRQRQARRRRAGLTDLDPGPDGGAAEGGRAARREAGSGKRSRLLLRSLLAVVAVVAVVVAARMVLPERGGAATDGTAARAGWTTYTHPDGVYQIDIPTGWRVVQRDPRVTDFIAPTGRSQVRVQWSTSKRDPATALTESVATFRRSHDGFRIRATHLALAGPERRTYFLVFSTLNADFAKRGAALRDEIERGFRPAA